MLQKVDYLNHLRDRVEHHLSLIYREILDEDTVSGLAGTLLEEMRLDHITEMPQAGVSQWSQKDAWVITYGDSVMLDDEMPLQTLKRFFDQYAAEVIDGLHILPFYPYSSDDGFAVMDYTSVRESLGTWHDINAIAGAYNLMADLVINHCSSRSLWFENFMQGQDPGRGYFFTVAPNTDTSRVVRPRTTPLLREVQTADGPHYIWCTFGPDQVDFDFRNPEVIRQFVSIIRRYLDNGVRIFRLDAVAFLWKKPGSTCINLEETHEVVRLLRTLIEHARPDAILITETNIPMQENLSYFGNANEAHCVYNFSLPPLLLHTLLGGDCSYLNNWMMSMPPAQEGTAFFNFIASHDGIGLRPVEGLMTPEEVGFLLETMDSFGGHVSWRALDTGERQPYEINISLFDALKGTYAGADDLGERRFLCAHAIMFALAGIPGIYIHSLLATPNDHGRVEHTGQYRAINRHQWRYDELTECLHDPDSHHHRIFRRMKMLLAIRREQAAFHPNAAQFTLHLGSGVFGFRRESRDHCQSVFCVSNITQDPRDILLEDINLMEGEHWVDLISGSEFPDIHQEVTLQPYQSLWITNRPNHSESTADGRV